MRKRIGILGGTFDPVHNAHLELASLALEQYKLDSVLFIPAGMPVRKLGKTHATAEQRLAMLECACADIPGFEVSTIEIERPHVSYTIDTLNELRNLYGVDAELFLIVGEDSLRDIKTWKDSDKIAELATILYAKRPGGSGALQFPEGFTCLGIEMQEQDISSSTVREDLLQGGGAQSPLPQAVFDYIQKQGLYASAR